MSADADAADEADIDEEEESSEEDAKLLDIDDLKVHFDPGGQIRSWLTDTKVRAVDGVSLDMDEHDIIALVGESGSGKTTLGKSAVGLQKPTDGSIEYRGHDIWETKANPRHSEIEFSEIRRSMQIIHQDPSTALNSSRRVRSILSDPLKKWRPELGPDDRMETITRFLEYVDMTPAEDYADRYPHQLSGGEQQRVTLGRALLMNPDVILADEAVSALDVSLRVEMMDLMLELQDIFNTSYLFISHDLANARYLTKHADGEIAIMYLGNIVEIGPPDEVLTDPSHPYTEVLRWAAPPIEPEAAQRAIKEKPPVRRIDIPDPADPPSGCKFHTRCPEAREACADQEPELYDTGGEARAACFRTLDDHEYWDSTELEGQDEIGFSSTNPEDSS